MVEAEIDTFFLLFQRHIGKHGKREHDVLLYILRIEQSAALEKHSYSAKVVHRDIDK